MPLQQVPTQNAVQYTLDAVLSAGASSLTLDTNVDGIIQAPGVLVVDRIDSNDALTPTKREYISFTGVSGTSITGLTRNVDGGGSDQEHAVGAIVEFMPDVVWAQAIYDHLTREHTVYGGHESLPSVAGIAIQELVARSRIKASAASVTGLVPIRPVWVIPGTASAATTAIGKPLPMPDAGNIDFVNIVLRAPISGASLIIDINKNFSSIFESGTRPVILGGGTFVSHASINTKAFARGDIFTVDIDAGGWFEDAIVSFHSK